MKKILVYIGLAFVAVLGNMNNSIAQTQVQEGNVIIDPYYGGPNLGKNLLRTSFGDDVDLKWVGPMGLRTEYMLTDNFGLGVDFIYKEIVGLGVVDSLVVNPLSNEEELFESYDVQLNIKRYRFQLRMNYHFTQTDNVDAYVGFGAGTNTRSIKINTSHPKFKDFKVPSFLGFFSPISFRLAIGTRYYITDNLGFNVELGLGGPVVSGGLSLKF